MKNPEQKKTCNICGGTGQVSFFKGVSRFLLTTEECGGCAGTGYVLDEQQEGSGSQDSIQSDNSDQER